VRVLSYRRRVVTRRPSVVLGKAGQVAGPGLTNATLEDSQHIRIWWRRRGGWVPFSARTTVCSDQRHEL
jgi:hypothetical protein